MVGVIREMGLFRCFRFRRVPELVEGGVECVYH